MTRKQAIFNAIKALSGKAEYEETIRLLKDLYDELPLIHWSDKSIRDRIEQFIADNGRVPTLSDFRKKGMPPHPVFRQKYRINLSEWLEHNYPNPKPTREELKAKYTREFKKEYRRLKPHSCREYQKKRDKSTKCWQTIAQYYGVRSWRALLKALNLPIYSSPNPSRKTSAFTVNVNCDLNDL